MQSELDKNEKYILVCRSGNRSATASKLLIEKGFKEIYNLSGGMNGWSGEVIK
jgi:rhodanese-related sulfurtransferase